jgi:hypothetical protein
VSGEDERVLARAALRLAELHGVQGRRQEALDLIGRAVSLGADEDPELRDLADSLRLRLAAERGDDLGVRGPDAGTKLDGVSAEAAARFAKAEKLLVGYLGVRVRASRIEFHDDDIIRLGQRLMAAERAYRQVAELGEPVATAAAHFRIASLYHDGALEMLNLDVPPELDESYRRQQRAQNRAAASRWFKNARDEYRRSLAVGGGAAGAELWHAAARSGASFLPP